MIWICSHCICCITLFLLHHFPHDLNHTLIRSVSSLQQVWEESDHGLQIWPTEGWSSMIENKRGIAHCGPRSNSFPFSHHETIWHMPPTHMFVGFSFYVNNLVPLISASAHNHPIWIWYLTNVSGHFLPGRALFITRSIAIAPCIKLQPTDLIFTSLDLR